MFLLARCVPKGVLQPMNKEHNTNAAGTLALKK